MPQQKRGPWSATEDQYLLHLVHVHGAHNWVRISAAIQTRSPKQCRERFHQNLKPNLNHDPITPEEGILIEQMVAEMGKRWAEIARRLRGRSDNAVKNWWNGGMNRRRRSQHQQRADAEASQHQAHQLVQQQQQQLHQQPLPHLQMQVQHSQHQQLPHQHISQHQLQQSHTLPQHPHHTQHLHHQQQQQHNPQPMSSQTPLTHEQTQIHHVQHSHPSNIHPIGLVVPPNMTHPVMNNYSTHTHPQYFTQPVFQQPVAAPMQQHMNVPSNVQMFPRATGLMIDAPLPSPSAYSQLSADGPPSLVSDGCSSAARSPNNGTSPIELPPIAGQSNDRRHSSAPIIRLDVPHQAFPQPQDYQMMQMKQIQPMLQDAFQPQSSQYIPQQQQHALQHAQQFPHPAQYLPSQPRRSVSHQQMQVQQIQHQQQEHFIHAHSQYQIAPQMLQQDLKSMHPSVPSTPLQLPGISRMEDKVLPLDPALHTPTDQHSPTTPDGSPRDKMSLSNLTH